MPFLIGGLFLVAWFVWANWGRDKAEAELNRGRGCWGWVAHVC